MDNDHLDLDEFFSLLGLAISKAADANQPGRWRCRELSLAITHMEEAQHWIERIYRVNNINKEPEKP